jgi:hypothetical protein
MREHKGQFEMVGLVFVVLIIVLGVFLYVILGNNNNGQVARSALHEEAMRSYLLTLAQTEVTACEANVYTVAKACAQHETAGRCNDACTALQEAIDNTIASTLELQGFKYNLTIDGTSVMSATNGCNQKTSMIYAAPELPIPVDGGTRKMTLALCR